MYDSKIIQLLRDRGQAQTESGRYKDAIKSYNQVAKIDPEYDSWYSKAYFFARIGIIEGALENLQQAIELNPQMSRFYAEIDIAFDGIRHDDRFQKLIQTINEEN